MKAFWKGYIWSCIIVSIGTLFIYVTKSNEHTFDWNVLAQIIPLSWLMLLIFGVSFIFIFGKGEFE